MINKDTQNYIEDRVKESIKRQWSTSLDECLERIMLSILNDNKLEKTQEIITHGRHEDIEQ